jgi:hypothetical protein
MVVRFIRRLGSTYSHHVGDFQRNRVFIRNKETDDDDDELKIVSFNELVRATLTEEQRLKRDEDNTALIGMPAHQTLPLTSTGLDQKVVDWCTRCNITGHKLPTCFHEHKHLRPPGWKPQGERKKGKGKKGEKDGTRDYNRDNGRQKKRHRANSEASDDIIAAVAMLSSKELRDEFIMDSGCSNHCTWNRELFVEYTELSNPPQIKGIGGSKVTPIGVGTIRLLTDKKTLLLKETYHSPAAGANLISSGQLHQKGHRFGYNNALTRGGGSVVRS